MRPKPQTLGWIIIVYAGLHWVSFLQLQGIVAAWVETGRPSGAWDEVLSPLIWLTFVVGGIALVGNRRWGRWVVVVASTAAAGVPSVLLVGAIADAPPTAPRLDLYGRATQALYISVAVVLLFAALRLEFRDSGGSPSSAIEAAARSSAIHRLDVAYGMFAWIAFAITALWLASLIPMEDATIQVLGMLVGAPVGLLTLGTVAAGLVFAVICFREWPLPVMFALVVSLPIVVAAWFETLPVVVATWIVASVAALFFFCVRWYVVVRKRRRRAGKGPDARAAS